MQIESPEVRDIGRFIRARRESTSANNYNELPQRRRHVPHLTQGDLAELVRVSNVVISQIEQGRYPNLTHGILHRIANSLRFTPQQENYLFGLNEPRPALQKSTEPAPDWVITSINLTQHPAAVLNPAYDILAINPKALALFGNLSTGFAPNRNSAFSIFSLPGLRQFIDDWPSYAASVVSGLRYSHATYPSYRNYIEEVTARMRQTDEQFGRMWDQDDPLVKATIQKLFHHPRCGELHLLQILTDIVEAPDLTKIEFLPANDDTAAKLKQL